MTLEILPGSPRCGVGRDIRRLGVVERDDLEEARRLPLGIAVDDHVVGLPGKPVSGEAGRLRTFVLGHHIQQRRYVLLGRLICLSGVAGFPLQEWSYERTVAMQIHIIEENTPLVVALLVKGAVVVGTSATMQLSKPGRIAPAQIGRQRIASEVMWKDPMRSQFNKRQPTQPIK